MKDELGDVMREYRVFEMARALVAARKEADDWAQKYDQLARVYFNAVVKLEQIEGVLKGHTCEDG